MRQEIVQGLEGRGRRPRPDNVGAKPGENVGKIWGKPGEIFEHMGKTRFFSWILGFLMDFDGFHTIYNPCHGTVV